MNPTAALASLPHGPEFRFLDEVRTLAPGIRAEGSYRIRGDEAFLAGHFPGYPLMPGVILVEAVAQLAGIVAQSDPRHPPQNGLKLTAIRAAKIHGSGVPGDTLMISAAITGRLGSLIQAQGEIKIGDHTVLTTQVTLSGDPAEEPVKAGNAPV